MKAMLYRILVATFKSELYGARFFMPLGLIAGFAMELSSLLPDRINRNTFSSMINDHLPWTTISFLFLIQLTAAFSYPLLPSNNIKKYLRGLMFAFTKKLLQLCAPATFVIIGLTIASATIGILTLSTAYFHYSAFFALTSLLPITLHQLSILCITKIARYRGKAFRPFFIIMALSISIAPIVAMILNEDPMEINFKLSLGDYYLVKEVADKQGKEIFEYAREATINSALPKKPEDDL